MKTFLIPQGPVTPLSPEELREAMRKHHWRQYFLARRRLDAKMAEYHQTVARSLEARRLKS